MRALHRMQICSKKHGPVDAERGRARFHEKKPKTVEAVGISGVADTL